MQGSKQTSRAREGFTMLVLTRKLSQSIMVGEIEVTVVEVHGDSIRLGIAAPRGVVVDRKEIWLEKQQGKQNAEAQA